MKDYPLTLGGITDATATFSTAIVIRFAIAHTIPPRGG